MISLSDIQQMIHANNPRPVLFLTFTCKVFSMEKIAIYGVIFFLNHRTGWIPQLMTFYQNLWVWRLKFESCSQNIFFISKWMWWLRGTYLWLSYFFCSRQKKNNKLFWNAEAIFLIWFYFKCSSRITSCRYAHSL